MHCMPLHVQGTACFSHGLHLPGFLFRYPFLTHGHVAMHNFCGQLLKPIACYVNTRTDTNTFGIKQRHWDVKSESVRLALETQIVFLTALVDRMV